MISNIPCRGYGPGASIGFIVVRGFSIGGAVETIIDTHDLVWDDETYRKYQERLKKLRESRERDERRLEKRKLNLRKELTQLYRGLPLEVIAEAPLVEPELTAKAAAKPQNFDAIIGNLERLSAHLNTAQINLVQEYRRIEEEADEADLEIILMEIL